MAEIFLFAVCVFFFLVCVIVFYFCSVPNQNKTRGKDTLKRVGLGFFETCGLFSVGVCVFCVWSVSFLSWFWLDGQNKTKGNEKDSTEIKQKHHYQQQQQQHWLCTKENK